MMCGCAPFFRVHTHIHITLSCLSIHAYLTVSLQQTSPVRPFVHHHVIESISLNTPQGYKYP